MDIKLYVGNLDYGVGDRDLEKLFSLYGSVSYAQVIKDRDNGRSKGFGFVKLGTKQEGQAAIYALNWKDIEAAHW